jgi:hypothetical protein
VRGANVEVTSNHSRGRSYHSGGSDDAILYPGKIRVTRDVRINEPHGQLEYDEHQLRHIRRNEIV